MVDCEAGVEDMRRMMRSIETIRFVSVNIDGVSYGHPVS